MNFRWFYVMVHCISWHLSAQAQWMESGGETGRLQQWLWAKGGALEYWADCKLGYEDKRPSFDDGQPLE